MSLFQNDLWLWNRIQLLCWINELEIDPVICTWEGIKKLQVFGDSKLVIDWFNRTTLYHTDTPYTISRGGRHICLGINLMTSYVQIFTGRETPFLISYPRKGHSRFRAHGWSTSTTWQNIISTTIVLLQIIRH